MKSTKILTIALLFSFSASFAQTKVQVVGTVRDENNKPLQFATVTVKNTNTVTTTNEKGEYAIDVPPDGKVLLFTFVGKAAAEEIIGNRTTVDVSLHPAISTLDDVVIVGYGEVRKSDLTGAVGSIKSDEIIRTNPTSFEQGLQGKIAGVQVTQSDGAPGAGISVQVRGSNTFLGSSEPLYVIDGIPYLNNGSVAAIDGITYLYNGGVTPKSIDGDIVHTQNGLSFLNPNDIEAIEVLKDASATAIYGSRGANGVVLVTTKKGKKGKDKIDVSIIDSYSSVSKLMNVLNAETFAMLFNESVTNTNKTFGTTLELPYRGQTDPNTGITYYNPAEYRGKSMDWQRTIFRTGHSNNSSITVSGGGDKGSHLFSFDYYRQDGVIINSDYIRKTGRANLTRNIGKRITIGTNTSYTYSTSNAVKTVSMDLLGTPGVIRAALTYPPTIDRPFVPGTDLSVTKIPDPLTYINGINDEFVSDNIFSSNYFEVAILKQLKLRQNFGLNYSSDNRNYFASRTTNEGRVAGGKASQSNNSFRSLVAESILTFSQQWSGQSLTAVAGFTRESSIYQSTYLGASNFLNDVLKSYNLEAGTTRDAPSNGRLPRELMSMIGRINYDFKGKYFATVSFRRDGSSVFGAFNRWATFPSFALAWKINEESFLKKWIGDWGDLKLRIGYGITGNQAIMPYTALSKYYPVSFFHNNNFVLGNALTEPGNSKLRWESTEQLNVGIDVAAPKNVLYFTFDWYEKRTKDLLQYVVLPGNTGFSNQFQNAGSIQNRGFELTVGSHIFDKKNFQWNIQANLFANRNKILSLGGNKTQQFAVRIDNLKGYQPFIQKVGEPNGRLFGSVEDGFYNSEKEVRADPAHKDDEPATVKGLVGSIRFKELDGKVGITDGDRTLIGDVNPKFSFGITNNLIFKNFDASFFITSVQGNDLINLTTYYMQPVGEPSTGNILQEMYDTRWTEENAASAKNPRPMYSTGWHDQSLKFSRRYVEDGSFIRIKNITVGYTLPLEKESFFKALRIHIAINNIYTITNYSGYDPEVNGFGQDSSLRGVDLGAYPQAKSILVGLKCTF